MQLLCVLRPYLIKDFVCTNPITKTVLTSLCFLRYTIIRNNGESE